MPIYPCGVYRVVMSGIEEAVSGHAVDLQPPHGYTGNKEAYLRRLKRIEGQVRGIARMVDEDKYCIDILTQVAAVTKALHAVSLGLVEEHIGHCVSAVSEELEALAGVEEVSVELNAGGISTVTITSSSELSPSEIGEAVAEAGYLVVANEA